MSTILTMSPRFWCTVWCTVDAVPCRQKLVAALHTPYRSRAGPHRYVCFAPSLPRSHCRLPVDIHHSTRPARITIQFLSGKGVFLPWLYQSAGLIVRIRDSTKDQELQKTAALFLSMIGRIRYAFSYKVSTVLPLNESVAYRQRDHDNDNA